MRRDDVMIENAIYAVLDKQAFIGNMLQLLNIKVSNQLPTAGVMYNVKSKNFEMLINKEFFANLSTDERGAVFTHELYHILHKHLTSVHQSRYMENQEARMKWNISMDLSINQLIPHLPKQAMQLNMFKDINGNDLKPDMSFEYYESEIDWNKAKKDFGYKPDPNCEVHGMGNKSPSGTPQNGQGEQQSQGEGQGEESKNEGGAHGQLPTHSHHSEGKKCTCKGGLFPLDDHGVMQEEAGNASEEEMLKAMSDLLKRTQQKTQYGFSNSPKFLQDLLNEIDKKIASIDWKKKLSKVLRKSVEANTRKNTWLRPSKRFSYQAPGTKVGDQPLCELFVDTSGSISIDELNDANAEIDQILKVLNCTTHVNLFHTNVYERSKFKRGHKLSSLSIQSGGTDLVDIFEKQRKRKCDTVIIVTDGYYSGFTLDYKPNYNVIFVISKNGELNHPLKHLGESVKIT